MTQGTVIVPTSGALSGLTLVQDINATAAIQETLDAGPGWPTAASLGLASLACVIAHNTTTNQVGIRDQADTAWVIVGTIDEAGKLFAASVKLADSTLSNAAGLAVNVGTAAGQIVQLASGAKLPAVDGSLLTGLTAAQVAGLATVDLVARDQIALARMSAMLTTAASTGLLVQGKQWELLTDEWAGGSSGYAFTAGAPGYYEITSPSYANTGGTGNRAAVITVTGTGFTIGAVSTLVDGVTASGGTGPNSSVAISTCSLTFDFGAGASMLITEATLYNQAGYSDNGTWQWQGSNNGSSYTNIGTTWTDTTAATQVISTLSGNATGYRYYRLQGVSGTTGGSIPSWYEMTFKIANAAAMVGVTMVSPAVALAAAPSYADAYFLWKDDSGSAVLGTDLTVELSRDGGATWTTATITNPLGAGGYDGTYAMLKARASLAANPAGTSLTARVKTFNSKAQRIAAPALYAE